MPSIHDHINRLYVGTYTPDEPDPPGIFILEFDSSTGRLRIVDSVTGLVNPSFLVLAKDGRTLYCVNETQEFEGHMGGSVSALRVDPTTGGLTLLNRAATRGKDPCHLSLDAGGTHLFTSNYSSGNLAVFPLAPDGRLDQASQLIRHEGRGPDPIRQECAHLHSANLDPGGRFVITADLGLDRVDVYALTGGCDRVLDPTPVFSLPLPRGSGPRHAAWNANHRHLYIANELASTISVCRFDPSSGALHLEQTLPALPADFHGKNTAADIHLTPDGQWLYISQRGHDSLSGFRVLAAGSLEPAGHWPSGGRDPRNFAIHPGGEWLIAANQTSGSVVVLSIDPATGVLTETAESVILHQPVCVIFA